MRSLITAATLLLIGTALIFAQPHLQPEIDSAEADDEKIYDTVEEMPQFPGGEAAMLQWISNHTKFPAECQEMNIQGRVVVGFVIKKDGSIGPTKVIRSIYPAFDEEAVRVVKTLPNFYPGKHNDKPVDVWYALPVVFKLQTADTLNNISQNFSSGSDDIIEANKIYDPVVDVDDALEKYDNGETVYNTPEAKPQFPGGEAAMQQWIASHINYNGCDTIQGRVILTFVVRKDGTVGSVKVIRPLHPDLDNEAIRVVKTLPAFTPGKMNGIPVNVWYTLPITFRLQD